MGRRPCIEVRNIEFILKQPSQFFVFTFLSLQFKFSVHLCILCCLIAFPPHPFAHFPTSGYLLQTPDNSNFFQFPLKVRVSGSRVYSKKLGTPESLACEQQTHFRSSLLSLRKIEATTGNASAVRRLQKASLNFSPPEKLALLFLMKEDKPSLDPKMINLLIFDYLFR